MRLRFEYFTLLAVALFVVLLIWPDRTAPATPASTQATPTSIATVDLTKLWAQLDEQHALDQEIQRLERDLLEKLQLRKDAVVALQADLEPLKPGSPRYLERSRELLLAKNDAIKQLAIGRFQLILRRDVLTTFRFQESSRLSRTAQARQQIASRTMLHAEPSLDVTDELIQIMNNAYAYATAENDR